MFSNSELTKERCHISEYTTVELEINDGECIKEALKDMGYVFEDHKEADSLYGYSGDKREQKAHIIIRRQNVGPASNDVGFLKKANGTYEMIISQYDRKVAHSKKLITDLKKIYGKYKVIKQAKRMGFRVKSQKVDEKGRIKIKIACG